MLTLLGLVMLPPVAAANVAKVTGEERVSGRVIELTIDTPAFAEPAKVHVNVPKGYDSDTSRRWPVTYFTAGTMNRYSSFNNFLGGEKLTENYPSIIVSPDGRSGYWSDWYNGGEGGPPEYETYVIDQLIPLIDAHFRTIPDRAHRAIAGISMGGYGSLMLAARHPDKFVAAASLSGAVDSNLPLLGLALTASSTFDDAPADAIYGPRATQEVRWRGHNPVDLASNLDDLDLQVRTANGTLNPGIGEDPASADAISCVVEAGVYSGSVSLHQKLESIGVDHLWKDYGAGCHTKPNFRRETLDTIAGFEKVFRNPPAAPKTFAFRTIEPDFGVYGWRFEADPDRALEFLELDASRESITLKGSGATRVTTPAWYRGLKSVDVNGTPAKPGTDGRLQFTADLGTPHTVQQFTPGASSTFVKKKFTLAPHAVFRFKKVKRTKRGVRVCARVLGGTVARARIRAGKRVVKVGLGSKPKCRTLKVRRKPARVTIRGRDTFGHTVKASKKLR